MENCGDKLRTWFKRTLLIAALGLPAMLSAQIVFYGVDTSNNISTINPLTQNYTVIGNTGLGGDYVEGLAISPGGVLYGTDGGGVLYSFSTSTGVATMIGSTSKGDIEGLSFVGNTLIGVTGGTTPTLFSINTATGAATDIINLGPPGFSYDTARAMTVVDSNTVLISTYSSGGQADLYSANISTGVITYKGLMNVSVAQFLAMGIASDGNLYGFSSAGTVYQINQSDATATLLGTIPGSPYWLDATTLAIPEPSTYALLLSGTGVIWLMRRRTKRAA